METFWRQLSQDLCKEARVKIIRGFRLSKVRIRNAQKIRGRFDRASKQVRPDFESQTSQIGLLLLVTCYLSSAYGSLQAGHTHVRSPLALSVDLSVVMLMVSIRSWLCWRLAVPRRSERRPSPALTSLSSRSFSVLEEEGGRCATRCSLT